MKFQLIADGGVSVTDKDTTVVFDPPSAKKVAKAEGVAFSRPYDDDALEVLDDLPEGVFSAASSGEYEVGGIHIHAVQTAAKDTIENVHVVTTDDTTRAVLCAPGVCGRLSDSVKAAMGAVDVVCVRHDEGELSAQDAYSAALSFSPKAIVIFCPNGGKPEAFKKIAGSAEVVAGSYTMKRKDITQEGVTVIIIT